MGHVSFREGTFNWDSQVPWSVTRKLLRIRDSLPSRRYEALTSFVDLEVSHMLFEDELMASPPKKTPLLNRMLQCFQTFPISIFLDPPEGCEISGPQVRRGEKNSDPWRIQVCMCTGLPDFFNWTYFWLRSEEGHTPRKITCQRLALLFEMTCL